MPIRTLLPSKFRLRTALLIPFLALVCSSSLSLANPPCDLAADALNKGGLTKDLKERRKKELIETYAAEPYLVQDAFENAGNYFLTFDSIIGKRIYFECIVKIRGQVLTLEEVAISPEGGGFDDASRVNIGTRETVRMFRIISDQARKSGFKVLVIKGERWSGANPGRYVNEVVDLTVAR